MRFPEHHQFEWTGYDTYYEHVMPQIETILRRSLADPDEHYLIAINEAICNAARYATAGPEQAKIQILILLNDGDIKTIVQDSPISRALSTILEYAVKSHASDVHIEPLEGAL